MSKKQRNVIMVIIAVLLIPAVTFFTRNRNPLMRQLQGPVEGTDSVITVENRLSVVSKNNHLYTWQWNNLSAWPVVAKPRCAVTVPLAGDRIVYYSDSLNKIVLTSLKADNELGSLFLPYGTRGKSIKTSSSGKFALVSMISTQGTQKNWFKIALFDCDFKDLSFVFQKNTETEDFSVYDFTITDKCDFMAGSGRKDSAWVFVSDVNSHQMLWEKTFDEYGSFTLIKFSPDGRQLFVSEKVRHILVFDVQNGRLLKTFVMDKYPTPSNQKQNISAIAISPDGNILAADTEPAGAVWFWDIPSGQKTGQISASSLTVSDIVFSPDSKYLATGCLVNPEIKIWKVPHLKL